ncbi:hypothetical protein ARZXY2_3010 [Arthrobacter sp. ZXY-2]|nr:hypothetical protein ARZXY2_3010 [Arthrobacter sp. ZXY-2]
MPRAPDLTPSGCFLFLLGSGGNPCSADGAEISSRCVGVLNQ